MKTLLTFLMVALIGASVSANLGSKTDLVVTKDGKLIIGKVRLGLLNIHTKFADGNKLKISYNEVTSFIKDGETFVKRPLFVGKKDSKMVFMKLLSWRNGYSLCCYEDFSLGARDNKRYFVFKDENILWLEVDTRSAASIRNFFNRI